MIAPKRELVCGFEQFQVVKHLLAEFHLILLRRHVDKQVMNTVYDMATHFEICPDIKRHIEHRQTGLLR